MNNIRIPLTILVIIVVALGAWLLFFRPNAAPGTGSETATTTTSGTSTTSGLANPASVNCVQDLHGQLDIVDEAGGQAGYCHLPDGRVCEEWSLMRGGCTPPQGGGAVSANAIIGTWRSSDDPNYSVTIGTDGKWTDTYKSATPANDVSQTGTYTTFTSADPDPDFTGTVAPNVVYIKLVEGSATYYYSILEANGTDLQLSYLDRGNTLSFTRAQ